MLLFGGPNSSSEHRSSPAGGRRGGGAGGRGDEGLGCCGEGGRVGWVGAVIRIPDV